MGVILQAVYRRQANPTISVPAPSDGHGDPWWYDHLASNMQKYASAGFTHWQTPPLSMSQSRAFPNADGYGVYWEYDLGSKDNPTRFGNAEQLQRCCAIGYANGIKPLIDWVPHQRSGGSNGFYNYRSATGKAGRFPKTPSCFMGAGPYKNGMNSQGRVPRDPIAGPVADDFAFGDELCPINAIPKDYVLNGLIDAGDWLYRRLDVAGCRNDDTKGQAFEAVRRWINAKAMKGKFCIGEYAEGNRDTLAWWVRTLGFQCYTYDFEVKYHLRDMCNNAARWDMRRLERTGLASYGWPYSMCAVTFIENADSDTNGFGAAVFNKLLGYAYILTAEGWPSIYYRDYAEEKYCYGLKPHIDNLIWIHEHLANGSTWFRHGDYQYVVYERQGWPGLLVGLNNDSWGGWKHVTVQTSFGPNTRLHDYTGHANDVWTDWQGKVNIGIPPNDNGKGYVCYSRAGQDKANAVHRWRTTQVFEGADDLDIPPAAPGGRTPVTRIWCKDNEPVEVISLTKGVGFLLSDSDDTILPLQETRDGFKVHPRSDGWLTLLAVSQTAETLPYKVSVNYRSTETLKGD